MPRQSQAKRIDKIDRNFKAAKVGDHDVVFHDATDKPFALTGFPWYQKEKVLCRLPVDSLSKMERINEGAWHTAGGMVRFRSNSPVVAVKVKLRSPWDMSHMPRTGSAGVDLYLGRGPKQTFAGVSIPPAGKESYEAMLFAHPEGDTAMRDWTLNLPLYNGVEQIHVGLAPGAKLQRPAPFTVRKPILFYGGSICQGGCASRPANSYASILAKRVDAPLINLGFSGSAMLEPIMADLIASLDLSVFVMDTMNVSLEQKKERHEPFFLKIREQHPDLPVVLSCRADWKPDPAHHRARRSVVMRTYKNALKRGDKRVYFADAKNAFGKDYEHCTVDGCHPNDLGFMRIADTYDPYVRKAIRLAKP